MNNREIISNLLKEISKIIDDKIIKKQCDKTFKTTIWKINEDNTEYLVYDTGEKKSGYHPNSLGAMNGFDNVEAILPDTIEEVWEIMKKMKER